MGTHPIFESDFDCLTDSPSKMMRRRRIRTQPSVPIPRRVPRIPRRIPRQSLDAENSEVCNAVREELIRACGDTFHDVISIHLLELHLRELNMAEVEPKDLLQIQQT